jgi:hypothetical protein
MPLRCLKLPMLSKMPDYWRAWEIGVSRAWKANVILLRQTASIPQDAVRLSSSDAYTQTEVLNADLEEADVAI